MSNTPSDAEIEKLAAEHLKAFAQFTGAGDVWVEGEVAFARAVLAKWGTQPQAGAVPQGWKAVPVNPTPEMWKAAKSVPDPNPPYPPHYGLAWDAMLAASPTPPAEQQAAPKAAPGEPPGIRALMCVISSLRDTAHFSDEEGELTNDLRTLRDWAYAQTAAFQPSPTPQADSQPAMTPETVYAAIAHGDQDHRAWLLSALRAVWCGEAVPPVASPIADAAAESQPEPVREHDLQDVRCECCGYMTYHLEHMGCIRAARAPAQSVLEDAARWQWLADYLIGERTDLDEGIVACATIDALRQFADAARKQGANHD